MPDNERIALLNKLRTRARAAYLYLGLSLLAAIAVFLLFDNSFLKIGFGILIVLFYFFFLRKDIQNFQNQFQREAVLCSLGKDLLAEKYVPKDLLTLDEVRQDGCAPINNTKGIVRAGVSGYYQKAEVKLTDISYTYLLNGEKGKKAVSISGCYLKLYHGNRTVAPLILCEKGAVSDIILDEYYGLQGLQRCELQGAPEEVRRHWDCYSRENIEMRGSEENSGREIQEIQLPDQFYKKMLELAGVSDGNVILKWSRESLCAFVRRRYLGVCEADLKKPVTKEALNLKLFPELKCILGML